MVSNSGAKILGNEEAGQWRSLGIAYGSCDDFGEHMWACEQSFSGVLPRAHCDFEDPGRRQGRVSVTIVA